MQNNPKIFIYCALHCEAKALIARLSLKKFDQESPFAMYGGDSTCLTVTGAGKSAMAAGVAYSLALFNAYQAPVLLNIGIAGHHSSEPGELFIAEKITDADSSRNYFPGLLLDTPCSRQHILTVGHPETKYRLDCLYDMEASAFFETGCRFSTLELVHCLKIISDNSQNPAQRVSARDVTALVQPSLDTILTLIESLERLANMLAAADPAFYQQCLTRWHFTATQKSQLKTLLNRWYVLNENTAPELDSGLSNSKAVLTELTKMLACCKFSL